MDCPDGAGDTLGLALCDGLGGVGLSDGLGDGLAFADGIALGTALGVPAGSALADTLGAALAALLGDAIGVGVAESGLADGATVGCAAGAVGEPFPLQPVPRQSTNTAGRKAIRIPRLSSGPGKFLCFLRAAALSVRDEAALGSSRA